MLDQMAQIVDGMFLECGYRTVLHAYSGYLMLGRVILWTVSRCMGSWAFCGKIPVLECVQQLL